MFPNMLNPFWFGLGSFGSMGMPFGFPQQQRVAFQRIDGGGIPVLSTNAVQLTEETVDYGINPRQYNCLPCEVVVLLRIHAEVPEGGEALPVTIVVPSSGISTLDSSTSATGAGTTKVPVVDSQGNQLVGDDIEATTERLAYINKCTGIIRFLEFTSSADAE